MKLSGTRTIPAARETVAAALNDPDMLAACLPGCRSLTRTDDGTLQAEVLAAVGPVKALFRGDVEVDATGAPAHYRLSGRGRSTAGFAQGHADIMLDPAGGAATAVQYAVDAKVGGKLAQMGSRLIDATAKKYADQFFRCLDAKLGEPVQSESPAVATAAEVAPPRGGVPMMLWAGLLIAAVLALIAFILL